MTVIDNDAGTPCVFKAQVTRCISAIVLPFVAYIFLIRATLSRGYTLAGYYQLVSDSGFNAIIEGGYWVSIACWVGLFWPSAIKSLHYRHNVMSVQDRRLITFGRIVVEDISSITEVSLQDKYFTNNLIVIANGHSISCGSMTFVGYWPDTIITRLRGCLPGF